MLEMRLFFLDRKMVCSVRTRFLWKRLLRRLVLLCGRCSCTFCVEFCAFIVSLEL